MGCGHLKLNEIGMCIYCGIVPGESNTQSPDAAEDGKMIVKWDGLATEERTSLDSGKVPGEGTTTNECERREAAEDVKMLIKWDRQKPASDLADSIKMAMESWYQPVLRPRSYNSVCESSEPKDLDRCLRLYAISSETFKALAGVYTKAQIITIPWFPELPEDATILDVRWDEWRRQFVMCVRSETFDVVPDGAYLPMNQRPLEEFRTIEAEHYPAVAVRMLSAKKGDTICVTVPDGTSSHDREELCKTLGMATAAVVVCLPQSVRVGTIPWEVEYDKSMLPFFDKDALRKYLGLPPSDK